MSRFEPVFLPDGLGGRITQTALRHYAACPRSGFLAVKYRGVDASTAEMVRGKAVHLVHERAVRLMLENGEVTIPPEVVRDLADVVLAELPVPFSEHDACREMAWRIGSELALEPETVVAAETLFALDVPVNCPLGCNDRPEMVSVGVICPACHGDRVIRFEVRCRIDFAELLDNGARVHVEDLKSSKAAVTQEEIARKRPDGSLSAKAFQLVLYAVALAYGYPVREEPCAACDGEGWGFIVERGASQWGTDTAARIDCPDCDGRGRVETREPFPVAARASLFDLEFVYPAIEDSAGKMLRRPVTLTRPELEAYRVSLHGLVNRLVRSEATGDWPAVVSDAACAECPASVECPIPAQLKDHRGTINTAEECAEALEVRERERKVMAAKTKEITAFVKAHGPVPFGGGMVALIEPTASTEIRDKHGFLEAVDRTVRYGEPMERWRYVKEKHGSRLAVRAANVDEIDPEGSNE